MATVHIREIGAWLDSRPGSEGDSRSFLEIRFDEPGGEIVADPEMQDKVITANSSQGVVTITWDRVGVLRSLDIS